MEASTTRTPAHDLLHACAQIFVIIYWRRRRYEKKKKSCTKCCGSPKPNTSNGPEISCWLSYIYKPLKQEIHAVLMHNSLPTLQLH